MVANQPTLWTTVSGSQLRAAIAARAATAARSLPTAHLFGTGVAQQGLDLRTLLGSGGDEDAKAVVGEARIVEDRPRPPCREQGVEENAENRGERAEQNRHLEHDDDVGRDRPNRLAPDDDGPVGR